MHTPTLSTRIRAAAVTAGGAVFAAAGIVEVTHGSSSESKVQTVADHLLISFFAAGLVLVVPGLLALARHAEGRLAMGAKVAAAGTAALAVASTASNIHGGDYSWFPAIAAPANAMWLFGSIALAVALRRAGRVPAAVAFGLPVAWIATIPLAQVGGALLAGGYWMAVAYLMATGTLERREAVPALA
jgi:hypothetical protein